MITRRTTRGRFTCLGLAAALAAIMAGCSATTAHDPQTAAAAQRGGTLTYGTVSAGGAPATDPHGQLFSEADWARLTAIYDSLTVTGDDGAPAPGLALSWTPSADATSWTFMLRDDATFSDGTQVTAADALYSVGRLQDKAQENGARIGVIDMEQSRAVNDSTLVLVTPGPDTELPKALTLGSFVVQEGTTSFDEPVGSGPFALQTLDDQVAVLQRNTHWWGGEPGVDTLEIRGFSDPQAMAQAITGGSIDMAVGVQPATARASASGNVLVSARPGGEAVPLLMRVDTAPFDDHRVREAVKLSLDRPALLDQVYLGYGTEGRDMIRLNDPEVPADVPEVARDLGQARQLLTDAGYPDGLTVTLHTSSGYPAMIPLATAAQEQLAEVGITVEIAEHAPDQYWTTAYGVEPFTVGYYGGSTTFGALVRATVLSSAAYSETGWKDATFDAAWAAAMANTDDSQRAQQIAELHRRMASEGGWVVWGFGDRLTLYRDSVDGISDKGPLYDVSRITING